MRPQTLNYRTLGTFTNTLNCQQHPLASDAIRKASLIQSNELNCSNLLSTAAGATWGPTRVLVAPVGVPERRRNRVRVRRLIYARRRRKSIHPSWHQQNILQLDHHEWEGGRFFILRLPHTHTHSHTCIHG